MRNLLWLFTSLAISLPAFATENLFNWHNNSVKSQKINPLGINRHFTQGKYFKLDVNRLKQLRMGEKLTFNLPNSEIYIATITKVKEKAHSKHLIAYISDKSNQKLPVVISIGSEQYFMRIVTPNAVKVIQGHNNIGTMLSESQLAQSTALLGDDVKLPKIEIPKSSGNQHTISHQKISNIQPINAVAVQSDEIATVDVLFVYAVPQTVIDSEYAGDINTRIEHIIEVTNQIYLDSQVNMQITAADIISVDYPDDIDSSDALDDITFAQHEVFENIESLRFEKGADMVALLRMYVDGDDACGIAWANDAIFYWSDYMYSHTSIDCGDYVNAHELGHNMGLAHSKAQGDIGYTYPFARGFRIQDSSNGFSTVMAYEVSNASKIYKFSNPDILCTEIACGIDRNDPVNGSDSAYSLNQVRFQLEQLFEKEPDLTLATDALNDIVDANLKQCISSSITTNGVTYASQLKYLYCGYKNIADLGGISNFSGLSTLYLQNNNFSSIEELAELTKLYRLDLSANAIFDLSPISKLSGLSTLSIDNSNVSDLSVFTNLDLLSSLSLQNNNISELSTLGSLANLQSLFLNGNPLTNLSSLHPLPALKILYLNDTGITSLEGISSLIQLESIYINNNQVSDLSPLSTLHSLQYLHSNNNPITRIDSLANLVNLKELKLDNSQITTIPSLPKLNQLKYLYLNNALVNSLTGVSSLTGLLSLELANNNISNLAPLAQSKTIEYLDLSDNPITNTNQLANISQLTDLLLNGTNINDLSFTNELLQLNLLAIENTNINSISALKSTLALTSIYLNNTQVSNIAPIFELHNTWDTINLAGLSNLPCWQVNYIEQFVNHFYLNRPQNCSTTEDNQDFDGDNVSNAIEINNNTNPIYHSAQAGELSFQVAQLTLDESTSEYPIKIVRSKGELGDVNVTVSTINNTAEAGEDYTHIEQTVTFTAGEYAKIVYLDLIDDTEFDSGKEFSIKLSNNQGVDLGEFAELEITMVDQDASAIKWQTIYQEVSENSGGITLMVERPMTATGDMSVTVTPVDYTAENGTHYNVETQRITFTEGESQQPITVELIDDDVYGQDKTFYLELSDPVNTIVDPESYIATITIVEDEEPSQGTIQFENSAYSVNESAGELVINVVRNNGSFGELIVDYALENGTATQGSDFSLANGQLIFVDGELEKTITINITDDNTDENNEDFTITLSGSSDDVIGDNAQTTITINDNDTSVVTPPSTGGSSSSGGGGAMFTLLLLMVLPLFRKVNR